MNTMAIFKAGILAFALTFSLPLASGQFQSHPFRSVQTIETNGAGAIVLPPSPGSVIYKSETGLPDFMTKKSMPARPYPPVPKPYPTMAYQNIATL
jgi:hypothetical protein